MFNLVKNEMHKMFSRKKIWFFLGSIVVILGIMIVALKNMPFASLLSAQAISMSFVQSLTIIFTLFVALLVSDIFTVEEEQGTLKTFLICKVSRTELIAAKIIALILAIFIMIIFAFALCMALGGIFFGFKTVFIPGFDIKEILSVDKIFMEYMLLSIPLIAIAVFFLFLGVLASFLKLTPSAGTTIFLGFGTLFIMQIISGLVKQAVPYMLTTYMAMHTYIVQKSPTQDYLKAFAVLGIYTLASLILSLVMFKKKDILT